MVTIEGEDYMSAEEAARALGVKVGSLYAYVSRGLLASYRQGIRRKRLYRRSEVEELGRLQPGTRKQSGLAPAEEWIPFSC